MYSLFVFPKNTKRKLSPKFCGRHFLPLPSVPRLHCHAKALALSIDGAKPKVIRRCTSQVSLIKHSQTPNQGISWKQLCGQRSSRCHKFIETSKSSRCQNGNDRLSTAEHGGIHQWCTRKLVVSLMTTAGDGGTTFRGKGHTRQTLGALIRSFPFCASAVVINATKCYQYNQMDPNGLSKNQTSEGLLKFDVQTS